MAAPQTDPVPLPELWTDPDQFEPRIWDLTVHGPSFGDLTTCTGPLTPAAAAAEVHFDQSTVTFKITATGAEARVLFDRLTAPARMGEA